MSVDRFYAPEHLSALERERASRRVYFIRQRGVVGPVKIGMSRLPEKRLAELEVWSPVPLEVAAFLPGGFDLEARFHAKFFADHSHGEWFRPSDEMERVIAAINAGSFDVDTLPAPHRLDGRGGLVRMARLRAA